MNLAIEAGLTRILSAAVVDDPAHTQSSAGATRQLTSAKPDIAYFSKSTLIKSIFSTHPPDCVSTEGAILQPQGL
jgi:hypothetical protein